LSALVVIEPQIMVRALASNKRRLGWLAYRNPSAEGGHPTAIDPVDLLYRGRSGLHSSLQKNVPFTTHPKFDPATGEGYGFGVRRGPDTAPSRCWPIKRRSSPAPRAPGESAHR
jgi:hypothetical protein